MRKRSKRYKEIAKVVDRTKFYPLDEALEIVKKTATAKFDESVEVHVKLNINPKHSDQIVRGTASLPHGTGKTKKIAVIASGEKLKEAELSGADFFGSTDLIDKIQKGWLEFDVLISTPDMMKDLGKLGKILGPKGLMPSPKTGTVTFDILKTVKEIKQGRIEVRNDPQGVVHNSIGKVSFGIEKLKENFKAYMDALIKLKPLAVKGEYIKSVSICSSQGPGIRVDIREFLTA